MEVLPIEALTDVTKPPPLLVEDTVGPRLFSYLTVEPDCDQQVLEPADIDTDAIC